MSEAAITPKKHIFLCSEQSKPKCCTYEEGLKSWLYLKKRISELGLKDKIRRTRANCLGVCKKGPVCVIYPEGTWHEEVTPDKIDEILDKLND